jgi:hypothetical protein
MTAYQTYQVRHPVLLLGAEERLNLPPTRMARGLLAVIVAVSYRTEINTRLPIGNQE